MGGFLQAEKNLAWEAAQAQAAAMNQLNMIQNAGQGPCKLLVSNLHPNIMVSTLPGQLVGASHTIYERHATTSRES